MGFSVPEPLCSALLEDVVHDVEVIRKAAAPALAAAITEHPDVAPSILQQLVDLYDVKLKVRSRNAVNLFDSATALWNDLPAWTE